MNLRKHKNCFALVFRKWPSLFPQLRNCFDAKEKGKRDFPFFFGGGSGGLLWTHWKQRELSQACPANSNLPKWKKLCHPISDTDFFLIIFSLLTIWLVKFWTTLWKKSSPPCNFRYWYGQNCPKVKITKQRSPGIKKLIQDAALLAYLTWYKIRW